MLTEELREEIEAERSERKHHSGGGRPKLTLEQYLERHPVWLFVLATLPTGPSGHAGPTVEEIAAELPGIPSFDERVKQVRLALNQMLSRCNLKIVSVRHLHLGTARARYQWHATAEEREIVSRLFEAAYTG